MPGRRYAPTGDPALKSAARKQLRAQVKALGLPCARCGMEIDYQAKRGPLSYVLGEIMPRYLGGSATDPNNVQPEHWRCSAQSGARITNKIRQARSVRPATASRW